MKVWMIPNILVCFPIKLKNEEQKNTTFATSLKKDLSQIIENE